MIDPTGMQLPAPTDWSAFERQMRRLFAEVLGDPNTLMTGRQGQGQGGVDVIGRRLNGHGGYVGIQCKLKDDLASRTTLGLKTLLDELEKASRLDPPPLTEFILVTTGSDDAALQAHARLLTERNAKIGGPSVHVFGWHHLRSLIGEHPKLLADYVPRDTEVADGIAQLGAQQDIVTGMLGELLARGEKAEPPAGGADATLGRTLDRINARVGGAATREALEELLALRRDEWEVAGQHIRFRTLTAIAVAKWELGEHVEAARLIEEAAGIEPDAERGLANLVAAHLALDRPAEALATGLRMLRLHPDAEGGLLALVQAQEKVAPADDPLAFLPPAKRSAKEAVLGAATVLRQRGDAHWQEIARRGAQDHPNEAMFSRLMAEAVLETLAARDGAHVGARVEGMPAHHEIEDAATTLVGQWREHIETRPATVDGALAVNAAQLLRMLDREAEAIAILREAAGHAGHPPEATILLAVLLQGGGDTQAALDVLQPLAGNPSAAVVYLQIAHGQPRLVRDTVASADWSEATAGELMWRDLLDWEAANDLGESGGEPDRLAALVERHPSALPPRIQLARTADPSERPGLARAMIDLVDEVTPFGEVMHLALFLRAEELWTGLLELLRDRITVDRDSEGLRWMVEALSETDDRAGLVAVFDVMPAGVADLDRYLRYRLAAAFNVGDLPTARRAAERLTAKHPQDLAHRLMWVQILMREGDDGGLNGWLHGPVEELEGEPAARADLALLLANRGFDARARVLAYRLARLHPGEMRVQERFLGVMIASGRDDDVLLRFDRVSPDAVFEIEGERGETRTFRLETDPDLPTEQIDIACGSPIALAAEGLKEGDTYEVVGRLRGAKPQRFEIRWVKHKHLHLMHELMATLNERFPESRMFQAVPIDVANGIGLDTLLAQVSDRGTAVETAFAEYHEHGLPLRTLPHRLGGDVIDAYDGLRESGARILATAQDENDRKVEARIAGRPGPREVVVDALTLELIRRLDILDVAAPEGVRLLVTQSTVDVFAHRVHELEASPGRIAGTLTQRDGQLTRVGIAPIQIDMVLQTRREALAWVRANTSTRPAAGPSGMAASIAAVAPAAMDGPFLDDVLAAAQAGAVLLSEDRGYRELTRSAGVSAYGLNAIIESAAARGAIDAERRIRLIARLAGAGHWFVPVSATDLEAAFMADGSSVGPTLRGALRSLGGPKADLPTHLAVALEFIETRWADPGTVGERLELGKAVADRLLSELPDERRALANLLFSDPDDWVRALFAAGMRLVGRRL